MQKSFRWWQRATEYSSPSHQLHKWTITPTCKWLPLPANDSPNLQTITPTCWWLPLPANDYPYLQTITPTCKRLPLPAASQVRNLQIGNHWVQQKVRSCHHEQDQTVHMSNLFIDGQLALANCSDICPSFKQKLHVILFSSTEIIQIFMYQRVISLCVTVILIMIINNSYKVLFCNQS